MVKPEWGKRYTCYKCGIRFYDMNKPEPICPACQADQTKAPQKPVPSGRSRSRSLIPADVEIDESLPDDEEAEDMDDLSLEELDEADEDEEEEI